MLSMPWLSIGADQRVPQAPKTLPINLAPGKPGAKPCCSRSSAYFRNRLLTTSPVPISQTGVAQAVPKPMVHSTDSCRAPS